MQQTTKAPSLSIVVPCYNESDVFIYCLSALKTLLDEMILNNKITKDSFILFIDDGSTDNTWEMIKNAAIKTHNVRGLKLSKNKGHQIAIVAGYTAVETDATVSIDADLQDDVNCIPDMLEKFMLGSDIVYGVRKDRSSDSYFKRYTAMIFYKLMSLIGASQIAEHADFRLMSKRAIKSLITFNEQNIYLRGIIPLIGFKTEKVYYQRTARVAGESKYALREMLVLAVDGITSLTILPLRLIAAIGLATCVVAIIMIIYSVYEKFYGTPLPGWTSVITSILFLGGVQLLCLGVIGEYLGKIYIEVKKRPKYFIEEYAGY